MNILNTKEGGAWSLTLSGLSNLRQQLKKTHLPLRMYSDVRPRPLSTNSFHTSDGSQLKCDREIDVHRFSVEGGEAGMKGK